MTQNSQASGDVTGVTTETININTNALSPTSDLTMDVNNQIRQRRAIMLEHLSLIPVFTGTDTSFNVNSFISKCQEIAQFLLWQEEDSLFAMTQRLAGPALQIYLDHKNSIKSVEQLNNILKDRFMSKKGLAEISALFWNFQQPEDMRVTDYIVQVKKRAKQAVIAHKIPEILIEQTEKDWMREMLLKNLNVNIRRGVVARSPTSLEELEKLALAEEEAYLSVQRDVNKQEGVFAVNFQNQNKNNDIETHRLTNIIADLSLQISKLTDKVDKLESDNKKIDNEIQNPSLREIVCFRCNRRGHTRKFCRVRAENFEQLEANERGQGRNIRSFGNSRGNFVGMRGRYQSQGNRGVFVNQGNRGNHNYNNTRGTHTFQGNRGSLAYQGNRGGHYNRDENVNSNQLNFQGSH